MAWLSSAAALDALPPPSEPRPAMRPPRSNKLTNQCGCAAEGELCFCNNDCEAQRGLQLALPAHCLLLLAAERGVPGASAGRGPCSALRYLLPKRLAPAWHPFDHDMLVPPLPGCRLQQPVQREQLRLL